MDSRVTSFFVSGSPGVGVQEVYIVRTFHNYAKTDNSRSSHLVSWKGGGMDCLLLTRTWDLRVSGIYIGISSLSGYFPHPLIFFSLTVSLQESHSPPGHTQRLSEQRWQGRETNLIEWGLTRGTDEESEGVWKNSRSRKDTLTYPYPSPLKARDRCPCVNAFPAPEGRKTSLSLEVGNLAPWTL